MSLTKLTRFSDRHQLMRNWVNCFHHPKEEHLVYLILYGVMENFKLFRTQSYTEQGKRKPSVDTISGYNT